VYLLRPLKTNKALEAVYALIRNHVPPIEEDRVFKKDIDQICKLVSNFEILQVVENEIGELEG
jgi:histidine ammonia-lyase